LVAVALNIADLAEHAIDAVPDRVALISGDEQLTYAELEEKANRLAHYLIDHGVKKDDKVGLYCRNRIEIVIAMLGIVKAGAILVNVNYRYVEGELRYLFDNSDMVAVVHERQYADRVANVLPDTPNVKTVLVVEDGSSDDFQRYGGVEFYAAIAEGSPDRDFGERSADDIYLLYTGGTTGFPKGVMWRHEDIYRVLFGGTDFATGEFVKDEHDLAKAAADTHLRAGDLDWTVLGPSRLTLEPATGRIAVGREGAEKAEVSREDVALVVAAVLSDDATIGQTIEFNNGDLPIAEALATSGDRKRGEAGRSGSPRSIR